MQDYYDKVTSVIKDQYKNINRKKTNAQEALEMNQHIENMIEVLKVKIDPIFFE